MPRSLRFSDIGRSYNALVARWRSMSEDDRSVLLDSFAVDFAYNSGGLENDQITLHDTREVFDRDGVSAFTGDLRTLFEIANLKAMWSWTVEKLPSGFAFSTEELMFCHDTLTHGTYYDRRWALGERPGEFKRHMYEVSDRVGELPEYVPGAVESLLLEVKEALVGERDVLGSLSVAVYLHAALVDIHPFADGNGRVARQMANMVLLSECMPPALIPKQDRMAYFGALDAFHYEDELDPLRQFVVVETLKRWNGLIPKDEAKTQ